MLTDIRTDLVVKHGLLEARTQIVPCHSEEVSLLIKENVN